jgi:hypothetical protein
MTRKKTIGQGPLGPQDPEAEQTTGDLATPLPDYEVGYGRPPVATRFKPGQSGNSRGRPPGTRNVETIMRDTLFAPITIIENGRRRKVTRIEALARRLMEQGLSGDLRATIQMLQIAARLGSDKAESLGKTELSPDEGHLFELLTRRAHRRATTSGQAGDGGDGGGSDHE